MTCARPRPTGGVTLEQVQAAAEAAGGIRKGDIVFGMMGPTRYFSTAGLRWLVEQGIKLMGVDSGGVELSHDDTHANVNHLLLFRAGIPLIENLTNLDQVSRPGCRSTPSSYRFKSSTLFPCASLP